MGSSRGFSSPAGRSNQELTSQEQARRDWINEQRGVDSSNKQTPTRMAGSGLPGIIGLMTRGNLGNRDTPYRRSKETRDWIDQQRGVEYEKRDDKKAMLRDVFGIRSIEDRQRYQDRNAWIDEQIRKGREEEEEKANQFSPLTQQERRDTLSEENFKLKDMWD